jgi:hypothetical protein
MGQGNDREFEKFSKGGKKKKFDDERGKERSKNKNKWQKKDKRGSKDKFGDLGKPVER